MFQFRYDIHAQFLEREIQGWIVCDSFIDIMETRKKISFRHVTKFLRGQKNFVVYLKAFSNAHYILFAINTRMHFVYLKHGEINPFASLTFF